MFLGLWNGEVVSLDPANGKVRWQAPLGDAIRFTGGIVEEDQLWVGTDGGILFRLSMDGQVIARHLLPGAVRGGLRYTGDKQYLPVATWDGSLTVFSRPGVVRWVRKIATQGTYAVPYITVIDGHRHRAIISGTGDGRVVALDAETGAALWEEDVGSPVHCVEGFFSGLVIVGTEKGDAILLDGWTGEELAVIRTGGAIHGMGVFPPPPPRGAILKPMDFPNPNCLLVFGSRDGILRAYKVELKEEPWEAPP